ncbi:hypothetical protein DV737_g5131, partial [Chaetothyriales sp. CBS 132003]
MWILESAGDFLNGKRLWLKPGKKYLFGRVKRDGVRFAIEHKTVSRRHLVIEVSDVQDGEVGQLHARTKVRIIDQNSKSGTTVNGHILKGTDLPSRELDKAENSVRPGNSEELIVRWQPCVVTFNLQKKELKTGVLKQKQDRLKSFGIKAIAEFAADLTTHLVVAKRNTPKGLQALITGKHLVTESFIDAIEYAATPSNIDADEDASPLELDFDSHWPDAKDYLPPPGREPTERPVDAYQPGPDRSHVFENYAFVFGDQNQFDNLLPVISTGHGKALHFNIDQGRTTVEELGAFMRNASGAKANHASRPQGERGGILLVRWEPKGSDREWTARLIDQVALNTGQRPVEQAEFLDAILANDASVLKQPIPRQNTLDAHVSPPAEVAQSPEPTQQPPRALIQANNCANGHGNGGREHLALHPASSQAQQAPPPPIRKDRFGLPPPPKKDTDDDFNPDDIAEYESEEEEVEVKAEEEIRPERQSSGRKRRRTPSPAQSANSFEEQMDDLLPAATAMKRRKLELQAEARQKGLPPPTIIDKNNIAGPKAKKRKVDKEINIQEVIRSKREQEREDEERRKERLQNLPPIDETDKGPANLVVVETLDIPIRNHGALNRVNPEDDPRWDPRWNGRKNFKKFKPQTASSSVRLGGHASKVFVPLVEVKRKEDGTGDRYWEKTEEERERGRRKKEKERARLQRSQGLAFETESDTAHILLHSDAESDHHLNTVALTQTQAQAQPKRRANSPKGPDKPKRQKVLPVAVVHGSDSDDSDDLKFQFSRARRGKGKA